MAKKRSPLRTPRKIDAVSDSWLGRLQILCLLLFLLGPIEALFSFQNEWFTERALDVHLRVMFICASSGLVLAALLCFWPRARARVMEHLDSLGLMSRRQQAVWLLIAYSGIFALPSPAAAHAL